MKPYAMLRGNKSVNPNKSILSSSRRSCMSSHSMRNTMSSVFIPGIGNVKLHQYLCCIEVGGDICIYCPEHLKTIENFRLQSPV